MNIHETMTDYHVNRCVPPPSRDTAEPVDRSGRPSHVFCLPRVIRPDAHHVQPLEAFVFPAGWHLATTRRARNEVALVVLRSRSVVPEVCHGVPNTLRTSRLLVLLGLGVCATKQRLLIWPVPTQLPT